jgi:DegV family protein with EDD domain
MKQRRLLRQQKPDRSIAILTDSCADVPAEQAAKSGIYLLPLQIRCSEGVFRDGVDLFAADIYRIQKNEMPASSLPLGSDLEEMLISIKTDGYTHVIALMMSSGLSGTYNLVRQAVEPAEELGLTLSVYDTLTSSLGTGAIALQLAEYLDEGMSFTDGCAAAERLIRNTTVFFSVDTLEYLRKGGRIGKITAMAGSVLQIKPILAFSPDGQLTSVAKVRGRRLVIEQLIRQVGALYDRSRPFNLMVADGGAEPELRAELEKKLQKTFPGFRHYYKSNIGGVLSIYTGSGVLGAAIQFLD